MSKLVVRAFGVTIDGYAAGPNQDQEHPLGAGGEAVHEWVFATRSFQSMIGNDGAGATGVDDDAFSSGFENIGAWIMGRNMFGPVRGAWSDDSWRGWWGEDPPFHTPVFVLTHYRRASLEMRGGTTFHFATDGIRETLERAVKAANGRDVRLGGGVATIRQYLREGLIDELYLAIAPHVLGAGESLFEGIDLPALGYRCVEHHAGELALHVVVARN